MDTNTVKYIVFDLGGVLINLHPGQFYSRLCRGGIIPEKLFEKAGDINLGLRPVPEIVDSLIRDMAVPLSREEFLKYFNEDWLGDVIRPMRDLIVKISQAGYKPCVLSNTNERHRAYISPLFDGFKDFYKTYFSYEMHLQKPDPEIFQAVIRDLHTEPGCVLLIDDTPENTEIASSLGIQCLTFKTNEPDIKQVISALNLKI